VSLPSSAVQCICTEADGMRGRRLSEGRLSVLKRLRVHGDVSKSLPLAYLRLLEYFFIHFTWESSSKGIGIYLWVSEYILYTSHVFLTCTLGQ
jgi:hypothetical protein